jgi:hypothetical protein
MKSQLIAHVNSYAAARVSGDPALQQFAAEQLSAFLDAVEITPKPTDAEPPTDD